MVSRYSECNTYYNKHTSSKAGALITTIMLSALLVIFIIGRATLDTKIVDIPQKEEKERVVAMRIQTIAIQENDTKQIIRAKDVLPVKKNIPSFSKVKKNQTTSTAPAKTPHRVASPVVSTEVPSPSNEHTEEQDVKPLQAVIPQANAIENTPTEIQKVLAEVLDAVETYKKYPRIARRAGYEGVVEIAISLATDGKVKIYTLHKSSGFPILDSSALAVLEQIKKMRFIAGTLVQPVTILVPIRYDLQ